jgi:hypothetical protein
LARRNKRNALLNVAAVIGPVVKPPVEPGLYIAMVQADIRMGRFSVPLFRSC